MYTHFSHPLFHNYLKINGKLYYFFCHKKIFRKFVIVGGQNKMCQK